MASVSWRGGCQRIFSGRVQELLQADAGGEPSAHLRRVSGFVWGASRVGVRDLWAAAGMNGLGRRRGAYLGPGMATEDVCV
jgi:hypothetical protein